MRTLSSVLPGLRGLPQNSGQLRRGQAVRTYWQENGGSRMTELNSPACVSVNSTAERNPDMVDRPVLPTELNSTAPILLPASGGLDKRRRDTLVRKQPSHCGQECPHHSRIKRPHQPLHAFTGQGADFHLVHDVGEGDAVFRVGKGEAAAGSGVTEGEFARAVELAQLSAV
jgi:hypothetical protein